MCDNSKNVFINLTNHPSDTWSQPQIDAARVYGDIVDYPFPNVPAEADEVVINNMANDIIDQLIELNPTTVCCQGEMTLTYKVVSKLKEIGICALAASSAREVHEEVASDGTTHKMVVFRFCRFREY